MKPSRRVEELGSRPEGTTGIPGQGGHNQAFAAISGPGTPGGYVRVPSTTLGVQVQQGAGGVRLSSGGSGVNSGVVTVPVTSINNSAIHPSHDHQTHGHTGHAGNKLEMHTGVHHTLPAFTASLASGTPPQGSIGIDSGRIGATGPGSQLSGNQGCHPSQHSVLHANPSHTPSQVRPRVGVGVVHQATGTPSVGSGAATMAACVTGANQTSGQFQRLKVEDALSYLDQVKLRFGRQPQVYNDFLDIMKEFKSQSIDTPGVIARVSQLFRGHPELIVGFNTFLPPGYKIEVHANEQVSVSVPGQQTTVVHTPQGIHHHVTHTHQQGAQQPPPPPTVTVKPPQPPVVAPPPPRSNIVNASHGPPSNQAPPAAITTPPNTNLTLTTGGANAQAMPTGLNLSTPLSVGMTVGGANANAIQPPPTMNSLSTNTAPTGPQSAVSMTPSQQQQHPASTPAPHQSPREAPGHPAVATPTSGHHHTHVHQPSAQPVEFNHAINYVNKIKHRFQGQPDIYKQFLEILHTYQKEQKHIKEGGSIPTRTLTEAEVYEKVAKLFENQEDLLQEFGQFLPDATNNTAAQAAVSDFMEKCRSNSIAKPVTNEHPVKKSAGSVKVAAAPVSGTNLVVGGAAPPIGGVSSPTTTPLPPPSNASAPLYGGHPLKRPHAASTAGTVASHSSTSTSQPPQPPTKRPKLSFLKDMSAAEAGKYATLEEYAFFDKVRKSLRLRETYDNFLRCVTMYNEEIISRSEVLLLLNPFLTKFPDLLKWFKDFVLKDGKVAANDIITSSMAKQERLSGDLAMEIDYTTCKRLGASYCALPKSYPQPKCSGRTALCKEVLNDTWVSFPSWSEDSTFVTSRKTQYEEYIYRCEDERFELDVVLETNLATIKVLEGVQKKLQRMSPEEAARFRLEDTLGGTSLTIHQRSIRRIYGEKGGDIIDGLKKNPVVAVPLVLRRLKAKDDEWREAQKGFNKIWREQNERYYVKSLDHQGITFKQNDVKTLRSKGLLNDIETLYDERHEQVEEGGEVVTGPHMILPYKDKSLLDDAANLIIHHVKRQTSIHKEDKSKMKQLVRHFVPDLLFHPKMELSDDEKDLEVDADDHDISDALSFIKDGKENTNGKEMDKEAKSNNLPPSTLPSTSTSAVSDAGNGSASNGQSGTNSHKRKTRSNKVAPADTCDKDDTKNCKDNSSGAVTNCALKIKAEKTNSSGDCSNSHATTNSDSVVAVNGDATEAEKTAIKSDPSNIKMEVKSEPKSPPDLKIPSLSMNCSSLADDEYRLFMCNNHWYLFFRLHQILCTRLATMYEHSVKLAAQEAKERKERKESAAIALRLKPKNEISAEDYYPTLLEMVKNLLDGNLEGTVYEDNLREMFGIHAYTAFTLDKVVNGAVRQLQHVVCDEVPSQCTAVYLQEARKGGSGGPMASSHRRLPYENSYQKRIEKLLQEENCFKVFAYKRDCRIAMELIDTDIEEPEDVSNGNNTTSICTAAVKSNGTIQNGTSNDKENESNDSNSSLSLRPAISTAVTEAEKWSDYVENYVTSASPQVTPAIQAQLSKKPVFLPRNLRSGRRLTRKQAMALNSLNHKDGRCGLEIVDNAQCSFNISNFKMVFVVNSDTYMYKKQALLRAKQSHESVSKLMRKGFTKWHKQWGKQNLADSEIKTCTSWFMGECEGLVANKTKVKRIENKDKPPFGAYNKYECEILKPNTTATT